MNNTLKKLKIAFNSLEQDFNNLNKNNKDEVNKMKDNALNLLSTLKRNQDKPENKEFEDSYEDLIYEVIDIVGQLN